MAGKEMRWGEKLVASMRVKFGDRLIPLFLGSPNFKPF